MSTSLPIVRDIRRRDFAAAVGQRTFTFDAPIGDGLDLGVYAGPADASYFERVTGFSVSVGDGTSAIVTFADPPRPTIGSPEKVIRLQGERTHTRITDVTRGGAIRGAALERELDLQAIVLQELRRDVDEVSAPLSIPDTIYVARDQAIAAAAAAAVSAASAAAYAAVYNVHAFGAVGDGVHDDTAAIQAAIDAACAAGRGVVYLPPGTYKITATLVVWKSFIDIVGAGRGETFLFPTMKAADAIYVGNPTVGVLQRNRLASFSIYSQTTDPTGGALVHAVRVANFSTSELEITAGYMHLWLESAVNSNINETMISGDANMTALAVGSSLVRISTYPGGAISSNLNFAGSKLSGMTRLHRIETAVLIHEVDGVWFDWYIGWTRYGIKLAPATNASLIYSVVTDEVYLDNIEKYPIYFIEPSTSYGGACGFHKFSLGTVHLCETAVVWAGRSNHDTTFSGGLFQNISLHAFNLLKGSNIRIEGGQCDGLNTSGTTGGGVVVGANMSNVTVSIAVRQGLSAYPPHFGVRLVDGATNVIVRDCEFADCDGDVLDETTTNDKMILPWKTDKPVPGITAAATLVFPPSPSFVIEGTAAVTAISGPAWEGREVFFMTKDGTVPFTAGATIHNSFTTTTKMVHRAVYMWGKWSIG